LAFALQEGLYVHNLVSGEQASFWQPAPEFGGWANWLESVAFSPDGSLLAISGKYDGELWLWRMGIDQEPWLELKGHENLVTNLAFSPDGRQLTSGSWDGTIRLWDVASCSNQPQSCGTPILTIEAHDNIITGVAFSPDGTLLASEGGDGTVRLWRVADGSLIYVLESHLSIENGQTVAFTPDGEMLAFKARDGTIQLCRVADGAFVRAIPVNQAYHATFSPNGSVLAWASENSIEMLHLAKEVRSRMAKPHVKYFTFSPTGSRLASGTWGDEEASVQVLARTSEQTWPLPTATTNQPDTCIAADPDNSQLVLDPDTATIFAYNFVQHKGAEWRLGPEHFSSIPVKFPGGDEGLLATIVLWWKGPAYQLLFRIKENRFEVVDWMLGPSGLEILEPDQEHYEILDLFSDEGQHGQIYKLVGASSAGTGSRYDWFRIVEVKEDGLHTLFEAEEYNHALGFLEGDPGGSTSHHFQYVDLDENGIKEIVEDVEHCELELKNDVWENVHCETWQTTYHYNGTEYVETPQ
jgi:dipeptidyl aminopeptidase/acylaminoacyl peptidase